MFKKIHIPIIILNFLFSATVFAAETQIYTLPIKLSVINPCNGDTVKITGKLKESITIFDIKKPNEVYIEHDASNLNAKGVSGSKYQMTLSAKSLNTKFPTGGGTLNQPGPSIEMVSDNPNVVPTFIISQDMQLNQSPNGIVSVYWINQKTSCK